MMDGGMHGINVNNVIYINEVSFEATLYRDATYIYILTYLYIGFVCVQLLLNRAINQKRPWGTGHGWHVPFRNRLLSF